LTLSVRCDKIALHMSLLAMFVRPVFLWIGNQRHMTVQSPLLTMEVTCVTDTQSP
jgi:hypothetical protein